MLGNKEAAANLAVKDLEVARQFYEGKLGLKPVHEEGGELVVYESGGSHINVYRSRATRVRTRRRRSRGTSMTWTKRCAS